MGKVVSEKYVCDRCGFQSDTESPMIGNECGNATVTYRAQKGARSWNGDMGGASSKGELFLCLGCRDDFMLFISNKPTEKRYKEMLED